MCSAIDRARLTLAAVSVLCCTAGLLFVRARAEGPFDYLVYVASEAADRIALVRFGPQGIKVEEDFGTGVMPNDIDGPHGLAMSPDGKAYFVSLAHGQPFGTVVKYAAGSNEVLGRATLGMFPATMQVTPDGEFLYIVNFNLHGDMVPSTVSVVATDAMLEVARIPTCRMPHGSRINVQGTRHYSACMMDDLLVEIDTGTLKPSRYFVVTKGQERGGRWPPAFAQGFGAAGPASAQGPGAAGPPNVPTTDRAAHSPGHGTEAPTPGSTACSPTWAQPSADGRQIFVACNGTSELVEVDAESWTLSRRIEARAGIYNLAVTGNGRLLTTNRRDQSVSVYDLKAGRELVRLATTRRVVHGVVVSPDNNYAFVSVEGIAADPGTVEVIDLNALKTVATVDLPAQAGGIDFWKVERGNR